MKRLLQICGILLCASPLTVSALSITEIMYDLSGTDTDREWVEIYNETNEPVTIGVGTSNGSWRFVDSAAHVLKLEVGDATLPSGGYAIITKNSAQFLVDNPGFVGTIFSSALSLGNVSATLSLKDGEGALVGEAVSYTKEGGGAGDGNSLQRKGNGWIPALPTPGTTNATEAFVPPAEEGIEDTDELGQFGSGGSSQAAENDSSKTLVGDFSVNLGKKQTIMLGAPIKLKAQLSRKAAVANATYHWAFGDGALGLGPRVEHSYEFAGTYLVTVAVESGEYSAQGKVEITVVEPQVEIVEVSTKGRGYIALANRATIDADISTWWLSIADANFVFPAGTTLKAGTTIKIPATITHLSPTDTSVVTLLLPNKLEVTRFAPPMIANATSTVVTHSRTGLENIAVKAEAKIESLSSKSISDTSDGRSLSSPFGGTSTAPVVETTTVASDISGSSSVLELSRPRPLIRSINTFLHDLLY